MLMRLLITLTIIHLHNLATVCVVPPPVLGMNSQPKRMQRRQAHFNLAQRQSRLVRMCSHLRRREEDSRPARTDSSAKQKSIGLLADGWGSTPSQTLKPLFPAGQTPQLRVDTLCSQRLPPCELTPTSTHYVRRRQKLIIRTVGRGASRRLKFLRSQQLATEQCRDPGFILLHCTGMERGTCETRGDCCTRLR